MPFIPKDPGAFSRFVAALVKAAEKALRRRRRKPKPAAPSRPRRKGR